MPPKKVKGNPAADVAKTSQILGSLSPGTCKLLSTVFQDLARS